jgi:membrane fusion protein (multidrug efflux system)
MLKQFLAWILVIGSMAAVAGGLALVKYHQIQAGIAAGAAYPEPAEAVATTTARKGEWSQTTRAIGTVVALQQVEIRNEIAGVVSEVGFKSGETVDAGRVLIKFDTRQEEAALAAAEAEARLAKLTLERRTALRDSPAYSVQEFDKAREDLASAKARAESLAVAIDKKRIVAPFAGEIGITNLQPGAYLDAGTRISTLQGRSDEAYVDFSLPQDSAANLARGSQVTLANAAIAGGKTTAEIVAEDNSVDRNNRTVMFRTVARGLGKSLRPGMFIDVLAATAPPREAVFVPLTALRRSANGTHVFVLVDEGGKTRARMRSVLAGSVQNGDVVILDGLSAGDIIAASGSFKLRDGSLVQAEEKSATSGAGTVN